MGWRRGEVGDPRLARRVRLGPPDTLDVIAIANLDIGHPVVARCDMGHFLKIDHTTHR